jgi:S-DNA-T family DNA segregation ATPase FtsK/SpoIIIE
MCERALEEESTPGAAGDDGQYDPMYDQCVQFVLDKRVASTSMLQRAFRLGYNRAARIIEKMEREGIVGPMDGAKPRQVLVPDGEGAE